MAHLLSPISDWANQDFDLPQIVSMSIAPLTTLFQSKYLSKYGVDANKINSWFLPLNKDFCNKVNTQLPTKKKIPCSPPKGCGIDDKCGVNKLCKTSGSSYSCCKVLKGFKRRIYSIQVSSTTCSCHRVCQG